MIEMLVRYISTAWASIDASLNFAFCALKLQLKMQSLESVNVISENFCEDCQTNVPC